MKDSGLENCVLFAGPRICTHTRTRKRFFRNLGMYANRIKASHALSFHQTGAAPGVICAGHVPAGETQNTHLQTTPPARCQAICRVKNQKPETRNPKQTRICESAAKFLAADSQIRKPSAKLIFAANGRNKLEMA
jgi:hypothetical protein